MKRKWQKLLVLLGVVTFSVTGLFLTTKTEAKADTTDGKEPSSVFTTTAVDFDTTGNFLSAQMYDNSSLQYKKDLALRWFENGDEKYFSMSFNFDEQVSFTECTLTMQTERYSITSKNVQDNVITFAYDKDASLLTAKVNDENAINISSPMSDISVMFKSNNAGEFTVFINDIYAGNFNNIGKFYSNCISTSSRTIVPLTFKVKGVSEDGNIKQTINLLSLNGQSFALTDGKIIDDKAPVLVLNEEVKNLIFGTTFGYDYVCLDVIDGNITSTVKTAATDESEAVTYTNKIFYKLTSNGDATVTTDDYIKFTDDLIFYKQATKLNGEENGYLDIIFNLEDKTGNTCSYNLGWYADSSYYKTRLYNGSDASTLKYLTISENTQSPYYIGSDECSEASEYKTSLRVVEYQKAVTEAVEKQELVVGENSYFYLPSVKGLIADKETNNENLKYSIYYKTDAEDSKSSTSQSYSNLKIAINSIGTYEFKIIAKDGDANMQIYDYDKQDFITLRTDADVWDYDAIPSFTFEVKKLNPPTITQTKYENSAYTDIQYTASSFDITAIDYDTEYKLYVFDPVQEVAELAKTVTYDTLYNGEFFKSTGLEMDEYLSKFWREVDEYKTPTEDEEDYEEELYPDNNYEWSASSLSFMPQDGDDYYMIYCKVTDKYGLTTEGEKYVQRVSSKDEVEGENAWLKDNIMSIVFLSIAGVSLIGIIVLLIIKPKDKIFEEVTTKSNKKVYKSKKEAKKDLDLDEQDDK